MDFLTTLTRETIKQNLLFDQIMTNGDWWKDEKDLEEKLQTLYDAGYDGKIGISYDDFHGQSEVRMNTFICTVNKFFGNDSVVIQRVIGEKSRIRSGMTFTKNTCHSGLRPGIFFYSSGTRYTAT